MNYGKSKIQLSTEELILIRNSDWILTKNNIIEKINLGLGELSVRMQQHLSNNLIFFNEEIKNTNPKISRGEKYQGLPYLILDFPRIFRKNEILAIRTLFWWGNYCSITLHVKGALQSNVLQKMVARGDQLMSGSFLVSFSGNEWSHDLDGGDYKKLNQTTVREIMQEPLVPGFLKLAAKVEFVPWNMMENNLFELFCQLTALIKP